jgi:CheY-like chemotaxis protein/anti-sigma regulatory factor (Ser/Thr protein kinase)
VSLPVAAAWVSGDKTRLIQIVTNLLTNAAKYTPEHGVLRLRVSVENTWAIIHVRDNGCGIGEDLLPRVFELFSQAERTPDRAMGGLGLGLALVKSLVDLHGGSVSAHSDGAGQGSLFSVRLPLLNKADRTVGADTCPAPRVQQALRIMVVDDNMDAAQTLGMVLTEAYNYQVSLHYSGKSALTDAELAMPDVFVLDIGLPDMSGYDLARRLRAMPEAGEAVMIALTGYGLDKDRAHADAAGFDHHLAKPANPAALDALLTDIRARKKTA